VRRNWVDRVATKQFAAQPYVRFTARTRVPGAQAALRSARHRASCRHRLLQSPNGGAQSIDDVRRSVWSRPTYRIGLRSGIAGCHRLSPDSAAERGPDPGRRHTKRWMRCETDSRTNIPCRQSNTNDCFQRIHNSRTRVHPRHTQATFPSPPTARRSSRPSAALLAIAFGDDGITFERSPKSSV